MDAIDLLTKRSAVAPSAPFDGSGTTVLCAGGWPATALSPALTEPSPLSEVQKTTPTEPDLPNAVLPTLGSDAAEALPPVPHVALATQPGPSDVVTGPALEDMTLARQKALFVEQVHGLAAGQKLALQVACMLVAARAQDDFPDLVRSGRGGASMLGEKNAWPNFRQWDRKMGRTPAGCPDTSNWRALLPQYRGSRPYQRPGDEDFWTILAGLYENPNRLPLAKAFQLARMAWTKGGGAPAGMPTYAQAHHYYQTRVDQKRVIIARHGEEYFRNSVAGYITRKAPRPGECWVGDHHIFDAPIRVFDGAAGKWVPVRPWLTAWLDWGTLDFVGILIRAISPNRDSIERCLRQGIVRCGLVPPLHIYIDNGKDYKAALGQKRMLAADDETRLRGIGDMIGAQIHFAIPFNARAKIIERIFGSCATAFARMWPGYLGNCPANRPETAMELWQKRVMELPTIDQFAAGFQQYLDQVYRVTPSDGRTLAGKTPAEARAAATPLRQPLDPDTLYKAFLRDVGMRRIERGGSVRALNRFYRSDSLWRLLGNAEQVRVRVDPDNVDRVWIYTVDGREVGPADAVPEFMALTDGDPKAIEDLRSEMQLQRRQIREAKELSAHARQLPRFLRGAPDAASDVFALPSSPAALPAPAKQSRKALPEVLAGIEVDRSLVDDVDQFMRDEARANLDELMLGGGAL